MISVVVPTKGASKDLEKCLQSLKRQKCETIIVDSTQETKEIAKRYGTRWVEDKLNTIGNAYAVGAEAASGDIIAFIDSDAFAPGAWIEALNREIKKERLDVLGGNDVLPKDSTPFEEAAYQIDLARKEKQLYGREAAMRLRATNIAFTRQALKRIKFNRQLKGLQEPELLHRMHKAGYKIKFEPRIIVYHRRRNSLRGIFRQIYRNGKGKVVLIKMHKEMISPIDILPLIFIAVLGMRFESLAALPP